MQPAEQKAQRRLEPSELTFRVLGMEPQSANVKQAVRAVKDYLERKRPGLARMVDVAATGRQVLLKAGGAAAEDAVREAVDLLKEGAVEETKSTIEVDPDRFSISVTRRPEISPPSEEREILRSRVRYFPYPTCEWFEISTGELLLTDRQVSYEPEHTVMLEESAAAGTRPGAHCTILETVRGVERGQWWDIPCVLIHTAELTYRYGWPARRKELSTILDVDEWLTRLRSLLGED